MRSKVAPASPFTDIPVRAKSIDAADLEARSSSANAAIPVQAEEAVENTPADVSCKNEFSGSTDLLDGCKAIKDQLSGIMNLSNNHKTGDRVGASEIIRQLKGLSAELIKYLIAPFEEDK